MKFLTAAATALSLTVSSAQKPAEASSSHPIIVVETYGASAINAATNTQAMPSPQASSQLPVRHCRNGDISRCKKLTSRH